MTDGKLTQTGDDELRARFGELRSETERATPPFGALLERAAAEAQEQPTLGVVRGAASGPRRRALRVGAWASVAVAAAVAGLLLVDAGSLSGPSEDEEFAALVAAYSDLSADVFRSPTSSLLEVPGIELMRSVPSIGLTPDDGVQR